MARRPALIAKKAKKTRVTHNEAYLVNFKYMGDELEFKGPLSREDYARALNWYNTMCEIKDAREYIETYLKNNNRNDDVKKLKRVPDIWLSSTAGWICRMINKGYMIPDGALTYMETLLPQMFKKATVEETTEVSKPVVSIQDRMREKITEIIGEIEHAIDTGEQFSLYDYLKANETPAYATGYIAQHYAHWLSELIEAYEKPDDQLKEAYQHLTRKQLKERIVFFHKIVEDAEKYGNVTKKTRAPRKPRAQSKEKILKNFKYQKEDNTYKIASINPDKIIGAQELWCFNTKYKTVTVFRALDRGGLSIKGTSIIKYDEKSSFTKGTGRKPEAVLNKLQNGGKIVLKKLMSELKTDKALQYRINENTILMKVVS